MVAYVKVHKTRTFGFLIMAIALLGVIVIPLICFDVSEAIPDRFSLGMLGLILTGGLLVLVGK